MNQVKENDCVEYIHVISLVKYIIISIFLQSIRFFLWTSIFLLFSYWTIEKKKDKKTNIKMNKQKEIRLKKKERNLDRIGQKLINIKGIKLRIGNIEAKYNAYKKIGVKMIR